MEDLKAIIESLLFVADKPMNVEKLADIIEEADTKAIRAALQDLLGEFDNPGRGFHLREVAGGYQFRTHPECQAYIKRMLKPSPSRLSRAALETLAIIAYKQPIIRSDVEHIRGVDSGGVLRVLMEKKLIRVLGRREIPGRPLIYATTKHFLEVFDLKNLKDLPTPKEIEELTAPDADAEDLPEPPDYPSRPEAETKSDDLADEGSSEASLEPSDNASDDASDRTGSTSTVTEHPNPAPVKPKDPGPPEAPPASNGVSPASHTRLEKDDQAMALPPPTIADVSTNGSHEDEDQKATGGGQMPNPESSPQVAPEGD